MPTDAPQNVEAVIAAISAALQSYSYRFGREVDLHEGIAHALESHALPYQREYIAGPHDRFDFLVDGQVVIEAKIKGAMSGALIQCKRYAEHSDVAAVILVTTKQWGRTADSSLMVRGKPVRVIKLRGAAF